MKTHRPFVYIAGFFSIGIVLSRWAPVSLNMACLGTLITLILSAVFSKKNFCTTMFLLLAVMASGAVYTQSKAYVSHRDIRNIARYYRKKPIVIEGIVASDLRRRKTGNTKRSTFVLGSLRVKADWGWEPRDGKVLVNVFKEADLTYGDQIVLRGKLHRPFNFSSQRNFSYRDYLSRRDIHLVLSVKKSTPWQVVDRHRDALGRLFEVFGV